jgi:glycosyltransferase involved in cell wall biosynthesis
MNNRSLRIANFMDSSLESLDKKGNISYALSLYNPGLRADKVVHFTPYQNDTKFTGKFSENKIEVFPYMESKAHIYRVDKMLRAFWVILKKIKRENINIIRGRLPYLGSLLGCFVGRIIKIPCVVSLGGNNRIGQERSQKYFFGNKMISYLIETVVLLISDAIIVPNDYTKEYVASIIGKKRARKKCVKIPWALNDQTGCDSEPIDVFSRYGINPKVPIISIVGFLNKYKYTDVMFEVIRDFRQKIRKDVQFVFCGDGPMRNIGESYFLEDKNVFFIGWQENNVTQALIQSSCIVFVPMSGFVLLEAARAGKPVISSNVEWHGEMIEDGVSGFLVEPNIVEDWVDRAEILLKDESLSRRMGDNLKGRFKTHFDPRKLVDREIELYHSLINPKVN